MSRVAIAVCVTTAVCFLAAAGLYFAFVGPNADSAPSNTVSANTPAPAARTEPPKADRWDKLLHHSPLRHNMRRMWVDCALITGNGFDPAVADFAFLNAASLDIKRRAGRIAAFWKEVREYNRSAAAFAKNRQWDRAAEAAHEMHDACGYCHDEYWPLAARAFVRGTFEVWEKEQTVYKEEPWGEQVFSAPPPVRKLMQELRDKMNAIVQAIEGKDWKTMRELSRAMNGEADNQYSMWHEIERQAGFIAESAEAADLTDIGRFYNAMTAGCRGCHARYADGRALDPLPWPRQGG